MKLNISDLTKIVSFYAPPDYSCEWDNVGFQVGFAEKQVERIMCALEVTPEVINDAISEKVQALIVHHPLIFRPLSSITDQFPSGKMIMDMIRNEISLIAAHTNLDKSPYGTNKAVCKMMELIEPEFLAHESVEDGCIGFGMGYVGDLPLVQNLGSLGELIKEKLDVTSIQIIGDLNREIRRLAIVTGSAGDMVNHMDPDKVDCLLTGELNHHAALEARFRGLAVICAGHYATEVVGMNYFAGVLRENESIKKASVEILIAKNQLPPYEYL